MRARVKIYAVNPMAASRYRDRHGVSRKKSDPGDALVLAHITRTDAPMHRPLPADTDLAPAVAVPARAAQDAVRNRRQVADQLRSLLQEYFPAMIEASTDKPGTLNRPDGRHAPTPALAAKLPMWELTAMLRRAGPAGASGEVGRSSPSWATSSGTRAPSAPEAALSVPLHPRARVRCPMLWPDPAQRDRLVEIRNNLIARHAPSASPHRTRAQPFCCSWMRPVRRSMTWRVPPSKPFGHTQTRRSCRASRGSVPR
ncbi:IS110 family transposase [Streptomyces sp. E-08]